MSTILTLPWIRTAVALASAPDPGAAAGEADTDIAEKHEIARTMDHRQHISHAPPVQRTLLSTRRGGATVWLVRSSSLRRLSPSLIAIFSSPFSPPKGRGACAVQGQPASPCAFRNGKGECTQIKQCEGDTMRVREYTKALLAASGVIEAGQHAPYVGVAAIHAG
jgi:hypothetical protein